MESSASKPAVPQQPGRYQTIQVHFVGARHVGLRALVYRICLQEYVDDVPYDPTGDHGERKIVMAQQGPVILNCDPIKSEGSYTRTLVEALAARSDALICVYSVADRSSFDYVRAFCKDIPVPPPPEGPVIFVAASKTDLPDWEVSLDEGRELSSSIGTEFLITSAKTGSGCGDDAAALVDHIYTNKARAEEERNARAANQAGGEKARSITEKSKVHLMISRVVGRLRRLRNKQDPSQESLTSYTTPPPASSRSSRDQAETNRTTACPRIKCISPQNNLSNHYKVIVSGVSTRSLLSHMSPRRTIYNQQPFIQTRKTKPKTPPKLIQRPSHDCKYKSRSAKPQATQASATVNFYIDPSSLILIAMSRYDIWRLHLPRRLQIHLPPRECKQTTSSIHQTAGSILLLATSCLNFAPALMPARQP